MSKQPILGVVPLDGEIAKCELQSWLKTLLTPWRGAWILFFVRVNQQPIQIVVLLGGEIDKSELQSRCKILLTTRKCARILLSVRTSKQPILGVVQLGAWILRIVRVSKKQIPCNKHRLD